MNTIMLYRYSVKNFGVFKTVHTFWNDFTKDEQEELKKIMDIFDNNLATPPTKFMNRPYTYCWFTQKGFQEYSKYMDKIRSILNKHDLKVNMHIRCVAPNDGTILYNDGNQMIVTERVTSFYCNDDEMERLYDED